MLNLHTIVGYFSDFQEQRTCVNFEGCWKRAHLHQQRLLKGEEEKAVVSDGHPPDPELESDSFVPVPKFKLRKHSVSSVCVRLSS